MPVFITEQMVGHKLKFAPTRTFRATSGQERPLNHDVNPNGTTAQAHGRFIKAPCRRCAVCSTVRGRAYRDALIMLEFGPTSVPRCSVCGGQRWHNLGLDPHLW